jgi:hypothetical protein
MIKINLLSENLIAFGIVICIAYGFFNGTVNRFLLLYITFTRARILWSLRHALQSEKKTEKDHIRETILFGLIPGALLGVAQCTNMAMYAWAYGKRWPSITMSRHRGVFEL